MDQRIEAHAATLVDWSARIESGDDVVLAVDEGAHDLGVAVAEAVGARGGTVHPVYASAELTRAYLDGATATDVEPATSEPAAAVVDAADVYLSLSGSRNTSTMAGVDPDTYSAYRRTRQPVREARGTTDRISTLHPTRALAQQAGMSYPAYKDFVYNAVLRDWEALAEEMAQLKDRIDAGSTVHIVGDRIDLQLSIEGRTAVNSCASVAYDSTNLPSGEVFTAPAAADGTIHFDVPMTVDGQQLRDVTLTFEDGAVVEYDAGNGDAVLADLLATDEGARRIGELGVGMNRGIDRYTNNILFDEKMGGTVHIALGRAYDACLPPGESGNESAIHVDLITDITKNSHMTIDGEVVQRNGTFRWEDGFVEETRSRE